MSIQLISLTLGVGRLHKLIEVEIGERKRRMDTASPSGQAKGGIKGIHSRQGNNVIHRDGRKQRLIGK